MPASESDRARKSAALAELTRRHLMLAGYSATDVAGLGDLRKLSGEQVLELIRRKSVEEEVEDRRPRPRVLPQKKIKGSGR